MKRELRIGWLYPQHLNLYADSGNVTVLQERARWRSYESTVLMIGLGKTRDLESCDVLVIGGGQDSSQRLIHEDIFEYKAEMIETLAQTGKPILAVCAGFQMLGRAYHPLDDDPIKGLGLLPVTTYANKKRSVGKLITKCLHRKLLGRTLVGFENHSGITTLHQGALPFGRVISGRGNGESHFDGAVWRNVIGTYMHGPLLPRNPHLADHILSYAVGDGATLSSLDDEVEWAAHRQALNGIVPCSYVASDL